MPYRAKHRQRNGVDLEKRTVDIERLALAGVYHYEIAVRFGISVSSVEQTMGYLRKQGRVGSMRGPRGFVPMKKPPPETDVRKATRDEYVRLCARRSRLTVMRQRIDAEIPIVEGRQKALRAALVAYDGEGANPSMTPESVIADQFALGVPADFIAGVLNDMFELREGDRWDEDTVDYVATDYEIKRPTGWDANKAEAEWDAASVDDDVEPFDRAYGLPDAKSVIDKVPPEAEPLRLTAPEPKTAIPQPIPEPPKPAGPTPRETADRLLDKIKDCKTTFDIVVLGRSTSFRKDQEMLGYADRKLGNEVLRALSDRDAAIKIEKRKANPHYLDPGFVPQKTPERVALLKELWETTNLTKDAIADRINELPGAKMNAYNVTAAIVSWKIAESGADVNRPVAPVKTDAEYANPILETDGPADPALLADAMYPAPVPEPESESPIHIVAPVVPRSAITIIAPAPPQKPHRPAPPPVPPDLGPPRLAKALALPDPLPVTYEPIEADASTIRAMADMWGITFRGAVDLWAVNKAAEKRGARPFKLVETETKTRKQKCLSCGRSFDSHGPGNRLCNTCARQIRAIQE